MGHIRTKENLATFLALKLGAEVLKWEELILKESILSQCFGQLIFVLLPVRRSPDGH